MHHLHPRSGATSTLFTTTLAVSFLVVGLPHLLPCPVDRRQFADSAGTPDGNPKKRRKGQLGDTSDRDEVSTMVEDAGKKQRECPVPKPGGLMGQIMGFEQKEKNKPVEVVVRSLRTPKTRSNGDE